MINIEAIKTNEKKGANHINKWENKSRTHGKWIGGLWNGGRGLDGFLERRGGGRLAAARFQRRRRLVGDAGHVEELVDLLRAAVGAHQVLVVDASGRRRRRCRRAGGRRPRLRQRRRALRNDRLHAPRRTNRFFLFLSPFNSVPIGTSRFCSVPTGFIGSDWVSLGFPGFSWGFPGVFCAWLCFYQFYQVFLDFTRLN